MRLPRVRLTVRLMMVLVAIVALALGGMRARDHYLLCIKLAKNHEAQAKRRMADYDHHHQLFVAYSKPIPWLTLMVDRSLEKASEYRAKADALRKTKNNGGSQIRIYEFESMSSAKLYTEYKIKLRRQEKEATIWSRRMARDREVITFHLKLKDEYERSAFQPWVTLPPEPPTPDPEQAANFWYNKRNYLAALVECQKAIDLEPVRFQAYNLRAWILATSPDQRIRDGIEAVASATRACELTSWKNSSVLDTLAAAYAEKGNFDEAIKFLDKALAMVHANDPNRKGMVERSELYRDSKPYRDHQ